MSELKAAALRYAEYGWPVFPLWPKTKKPMTGHGVNDATTDPEQIERWWAGQPEANIGVATGPAGLAVVDVDDPDAIPDGVDLPATLTIRTRPGRRHYVYTGEIKNSASRIAPGVDTRGLGGYIVVPPSIHPDTEEPYTWADKRKPVPLPEWVHEALVRRPRKNRTENGTVQASRYGRTVMDALLSEVLQIEEGSRNDGLFRVAVRGYELVKSGEMDGQAFTDGLRRATSSWLGEPAEDPFTEEERKQTLDSAWRAAEPVRVNARTNRAVDPRVKGHDLLDLQALRRLPPPRWLVPEVLPEGFSLLIGRYASLKSWVALDWAAAAAEAGKRVIYFVGEDVHGFGSRVVGLSEARRLGLENLRIAPDTPKLLRPGEVERLHKAVGEWEADLIVLDTWATCIPGVGENDFPDLSEAVEVLQRVMKDYRCSTLAVAHTGFQDNRMRGHTSVEDASDCIWHAQSDKSVIGAAVVTNKKVKNSPLLQPLDVFLKKEDGHTVLFPSVMDEIE